jgi:hypothetical protein
VLRRHRAGTPLNRKPLDRPASMADDAYWMRRGASIEMPIVPMRREALVANGPMLAVHDAIVLEVLGRHHEARSLLESFAPRLFVLISEENTFDGYPEYEKLSRWADLRTQAHVVHWLLHGKFDPALAQRAYEAQWRYFRMLYPSARLDPVLLFYLMLFQIESGRHDDARQLYEKYEKSPVRVPPESLRFSRNPRSLLYTHLLAHEIPRDVLRQAFDNFRNAATKWEKDVCPILYVMFSEAARVFSACLRLTGRAHAPSNVFALLR